MQLIVKNNIRINNNLYSIHVTMKDKIAIGKKFKIARESILRDGYPISQTKAAKEFGYYQASISSVEQGDFANVSDLYLAWLASNGVNLSGIYDDKVTPEQYRMVVSAKAPLLLTAHGEPESCRECEIKDREIMHLEREVNVLNKLVSTMEGSRPQYSAAGNGA